MQVGQFVNACVRLGWRAVVYNRRGHGGGSLVPSQLGSSQEISCGVQPLSAGVELATSTGPGPTSPLAQSDVPAHGHAASACKDALSSEINGDAVGKPFQYWPKYACLDDMGRVVSHVRAAVPDAPLMAVGFSAGANLVARYAGAQGAQCCLDAAVSVCNAYNLVDATRKFTRSRPVTNAVMTQGARRSPLIPSTLNSALSPKQLQLTSWICARSFELAVTGCICRAGSMVSYTIDAFLRALKQSARVRRPACSHPAALTSSVECSLQGHVRPPPSAVLPD